MLLFNVKLHVITTFDVIAIIMNEQKINNSLEETNIHQTTNRHLLSIILDLQKIWSVDLDEVASELDIPQSDEAIQDNNNQPTKEYPKKEFKKLTWDQNSYEGTVLVDNLHGLGFYMTEKNGEKYFYDGSFYVNKLEGYSQIFYENGTHFQGLFKKHLRYGPGILSYPDGTQDVGFWNGFKLIRLTFVVDYDAIPTLANTHLGKTKLLRSRYVVPLCDDYDLVQEVLKYCEQNENLNDIFNLNIRNPNSLFFHKKFYDDQFFGGQDCSIKVFVDEEDNESFDTQETNSSEQENDSKARAESLRNKICEVSESLQTFVTIKENISRRVKECKSCCDRLKFEELNEASVIYESINHAESTSDYNQRTISGSSESLDITQALSEIESAEAKSPSARQMIVEYTCSCDEEELSNGLQSLEEQLRNISVQETYYRNIRDELQKKLDRINKEASACDKPKFKMVKINELWAWNNEESMVEMQKHCFKHRKSEDMVNFSVPNLILGNRKEFGPKGKHEDMCRQFLLACSKGDAEFVQKCLRNDKVHPNIVDARGNNGMFYASSKNWQNIISILTSFGCKLDQINDEQLTPLSMCILKYIALKNNCNYWERGFLPETTASPVEDDMQKWYNVKSFLSIASSRYSSYTDYNSLVNATERESIIKQKKYSKANNNVTYIFDFSCKNQTDQIKIEPMEENVPLLQGINQTIMTLLNNGATPTVCEVPYPCLILSLFTENPDLVKEIIKANADVNVLIDDNMSCLHVIASLKPNLSNVNICMVLIKYGCIANFKTLPSHWQDRKAIYMGNIPENFEIEDNGKNPLHLLCARADFECDGSDYFSSVAKLLLETNIDVNSTYLGHTPLSLAVLSGNIKLAQYFIKTNTFDPYNLLEYGMGNILTLYSLKRFENTLPIDKCKAMLTALFDIDVNVLNRVEEAENAIVFTEDFDNFFDIFVAPAMKINGKDIKAKQKHPEKHPYKSSIIEFMKNIGRQTIIKRIQLNVTEILYEFIEEGILENEEISFTLATEYLTPSVVIKNLHHLFHSNTLEHDRLNQAYVKTLIDFADLHKKVPKKPIKSEKGKPEQKQEPTEYPDVIAWKFQNSKEVNKPVVVPPGLDDPSLYKICFHCLRGQDKHLKSCPRCQMIEFCSGQCNKLNLKLKTQHECNMLFYDLSDEETTNISKGLCLNEFVRIIREKCMQRVEKMRKDRFSLEEQKLLELWRADKYGTRFMHFKSLMDGALAESKGMESKPIFRIIQETMKRNFQKFPGESSMYSLENLLLKLQSVKPSEVVRQTDNTRRSTLGGSTLHSVIFDAYASQEDASKICPCPKTKTKSNEKKTQEFDNKLKQSPDAKKGKYADKLQNLVGNYSVREKPQPMVKKMRKLPNRYQKFLEVMETYFPDIDLDFWLLPYACCNDGQLYYRFCHDEVFKGSYSFL